MCFFVNYFQVKVGKTLSEHFRKGRNISASEEKRATLHSTPPLTNTTNLSRYVLGLRHDVVRDGDPAAVLAAADLAADLAAVELHGLLDGHDGVHGDVGDGGGVERRLRAHLGPARED
eukprot:CAMPEP_0118870896 /NCGR_PEP_ID=MMETSP1163-20130328/13685_1 /TAXON_ID=124430 /ORGANISM="Phaeomonas parva, Strain CCMP2877" /LENGTH=117 /DNA_ID=CAMNT_0006805943 /DNA_START=45 /DNA_END=395 /DNA_ORIENTATION=+